MDPSAFNANRIGLSVKAKAEWRQGIPRRRWPIYAPIIVIAIVAIGIFLLFHQPRHKPDWSILKSVPGAEAQQVEQEAKDLKYGLYVPTQLPFTVDNVHATLTNKNNRQSFKLLFSDNANTLTENVTNDLSVATKGATIHAITLSGAQTAFTATVNGVLSLHWTKNGTLYSISMTASNPSAKTSLAELKTIYHSMH